MTLNVAILGVGRMGENHLRVLSDIKGVNVKTIFDINKARANAMSGRYQTTFTCDINTAIDDVDVVIIATPTSTHFDYFRLCAGKVKNIFIEKPLSQTLEQSIAIDRIARKKRIFVQCGFIERFNPAVAALKSIAATERVIHTDFLRTNRSSSRIADVDVVLDLMIHDIDLALYLNGPVKGVVACGVKASGMVAFASAIFQHESGAISRLLSSRLTENKQRTIHATTEHSYIDVDLIQKNVTVHQQTAVKTMMGMRSDVSSVAMKVEVAVDDALRLELLHFIRACHHRTSTATPTATDGLASMQLAQLILKQIDCTKNFEAVASPFSTSGILVT